MSDEEIQQEPVASELTEEQAKHLEENGWYVDGEYHIVPLSKPITSGHGVIEELKLSEPNGFSYEKLGQPFKMLSGSKESKLQGEDEPVEIEMNIKKLYRYIEASNNPQLGFGEARLLCMKDSNNAQAGMLDFFGK